MQDKKVFVKWLESQREGDDVLGFMFEAAIAWLTFEECKPWLKPEAKADGWPIPLEWSRNTVLAEMKDYMRFAWGKALDHRGISASRSVQKFTTWLRMLGEESCISGVPYENYGAPILMAISKKFRFYVPKDPAAERMSQGLTCRPDGCEEGCGV